MENEMPLNIHGRKRGDIIMRNVAFITLLRIGVLLVFTAAIPLFFSYPYSHGPNSGPSNIWELVLMIAYDYWTPFLLIGVVLSIASFFGLKRGSLLQ